MITKSLAAFASPIITKAMETGGRGMSQTTTNYGGIGDALMKKAQLELNAATLKSSVQLATNEMNTNAKLKMIDIEDARINQELADRRASKDMSGMEKGMGILQGAMSGAMTGAAAGGGNPYAIAAGAVIGGAAAGHDAFSGKPGDEKRASMGNTNKTLGSVAAIATTTRGMYDKYKGNEAYKTGVEDLQKISQQVGGLTGAAKEAKIQEYNQKSQAMQGEMSKYMGPQEAATAMEGFRKGQSAIFSNDPETRAKAEMAQLGSIMAGDKELAEGSPTRSAKLGTYYGELSRLNSQLHGFDNKKQVSPGEFQAFAKGAGVDVAVGGIDSMGKNTGTNARVRSSGGSIGNAPAQLEEAPAQQGNNIQQAPAPVSAPGNPSNFVTNPPVGIAAPAPTGAGTQMDDGGDFMRQIEGLNKDGAAAVKALTDNAQDNPMPMANNIAPGEQGGIPTDPASNGGGLIDKWMGPSPYEKNMRAQKGLDPETGEAPAAPKKKVSRDFNSEVRREFGEERWERAKPFFEETDPTILHKTYQTERFNYDPATRDKLNGGMAAAAQMNGLKTTLKEKLKGTDREALRAYQTYRHGEIGDEGMSSSSASLSAGGAGVGWSKFEKSVRQSLLGKGEKKGNFKTNPETGKPYTEDDVDRIIQNIADIDSQIDPIAQSLAVAKQGSRPSDKDVEAYKLANMLDPNADNSIARITGQQKIIFSDIESVTAGTKTEKDMLRYQGAQGRATRTQPDEVRRNKMIQEDVKYDFKEDRGVEDDDSQAEDIVEGVIFY